MKLYFAPGACSVAPHIALEELRIPHQLQVVDLRNHKTGGNDYYAVNPKGSVPVLELDNGERLTENAVVLQYIADRKPEAGLMPKVGSWERYRALEWLNFIATELHKGYGPLWAPDVPDAQREVIKSRLMPRLALVDRHLQAQLQSGPSQYLMGAQFTVADCYLFVVVSWSDKLKVDISKFAALRAFMDRVSGRPSVQAALKAEGLGK